MYNNIPDKNQDLESYKERLSNFSRQFELGLFLYIAKKSIGWLILFLILSLTGAYIYLRYVPRIYESNTVLQIKTNNTANKVLNVENLYESPENNIAEAIELLRSKVFLKRALLKLPIEVSYFAEGTFKQNEQYLNSPYYAETKIKSANIVGVKIYVSFATSERGELFYQLGEKIYKKKYLTNKWINLPHADIKISINNYAEIVEQQNPVNQNAFYFVINDMDQLAAAYFPRLDIKLLNNAAKTVQISFKDNNAKKCSDIVSNLAQEFINLDVERKSESSKSILSFIDRQLDAVYEKLKNSEIAIQNFKRNYKINDNSDITKGNITRLNELEDQVIAIESEEKVLDEIEKSIKDKDNVDTYYLISLLAGTQFEGSISNLINTLHKLLIQREELLYEVTPSSEAIKAIGYQINIQKKLLLESIKSLKNKVTVRRENLNSKTVDFENKFFKLPADEIEYARLQRTFSINEKYYTLLLEKKTEYSISKAGFVSQNVILEKAFTPVIPVSPNKKNTVTVSILIAGIMSLLLIFIRYISHNDITSLNDVSRYITASINILGIVPKYKKEIPVSQLLIDKNPKSLIAESFRSVRSNLQFISNEPGSKVMAITSTVSGEGKTFVAINLAGIIAVSGKKVIILDLDMRKPKIHLGFNTDNAKGMSTILINKDIPEQCIKHSSLENLDFITAGPIPPNPAELIISSKMDTLIEYLKTLYELIIIDTPPVGLVSDGISIIQKADYPIYIFRSEYSKRSFIQNLDRLYNESNIKKLSVILNGVDIEGRKYGYTYGYGYGYNYGSGYGYYEETESKKTPLLKRIKLLNKA